MTPSPWCSRATPASNALPFTVVSSLAIATTSLPPGSLGTGYSALVTGKGGTPPYTWTAGGLPPSLSINSTSGAISGALLAGGNYLVTVVLRDAAKSTATAQFPLVVGAPPVSIAPSSNLPSGMVGVAYTGFVFANGGTGSYTFSLGGGSLPGGLTLSSVGFVSGTPKTPGRFSFSVVVTDSAGATASGEFSVTILPAPLNITGGPGGPVPTGTPIAIAFGGTGGVTPYSLSAGGSLPPGTAFAGGTLSGTPATVGAFTFSVTLTDSTGAFVTKAFTLTVTSPPPPPALSLSGSLSDGKVGVPYAGQISASGGTAPYTFSGSGLPDGLSLSLSGSISGTPVTAGKFSITATATDSKGVTGEGHVRDYDRSRRPDHRHRVASGWRGGCRLLGRPRRVRRPSAVHLDGRRPAGRVDRRRSRDQRHAGNGGQVHRECHCERRGARQRGRNRSPTV